MSRLFNLLRASRAVKEAQLMSRADLLNLQERRWRAMARYALQVSPFYRRHLAGIDVARCQLTDIPPLTKDMLVENWDEIVPDARLHHAALERFVNDPAQQQGGLLHGRWMLGTTSGTSGAALIIPHDIAAVDWSHVCQNLRNSTSPHTASAPGLPLFRRRLKVLAFVGSAAHSISGGLFATRPWIGNLISSYHCIRISTPWEQLLEEVQRIQPDALMGYASLMGRLAQAQLRGEISLSMPKDRGSIWAGGDAVTPGIRDLCRRAFGIEPFSMYGCGETLGIARQWRGMEHLHCHDDMMVLEAVDAQDQPVPEGVLSDHALVTPLINKALPLLRYRVHDRIQMGPVHEHWPFRRIEQIYGRSTMCYAFKTPELRVFIGTHFLIEMEVRTDVSVYQFRQTGAAAVECVLVPQPDCDTSALLQKVETMMRHRLDASHCEAVTCSARIVPELMPDARTGKVEQNVPMVDEAG